MSSNLSDEQKTRLVEIQAELRAQLSLAFEAVGTRFDDLISDAAIALLEIEMRTATAAEDIYKTLFALCSAKSIIDASVAMNLDEKNEAHKLIKEKSHVPDFMRKE